MLAFSQYITTLFLSKDHKSSPQLDYKLGRAAISKNSFLIHKVIFMKVIVVLLLLLYITLPSYSQSLIGTWQIGTKQTGEGTLDCYVFKSDNSFEYVVNSDEGLRRIIAIGGTYSYKKGYLELRVKYTKEIVGGAIGRSHITTGNDSWSIEGGIVRKMPVKKLIIQHLNIEFINPKTIVVDDDNKFYKIH